MEKIKKMFWFSLGMFFLGVAYIGVVTPGIPWSTPTVGAAYCFSKSSERWHNWIMNHKLFGPFIHNWNDSRVFPTKGKIFMFLSMDASLVIMWFATHNWKATLGMGIFFILILFWAQRFPGSKEEAERRKAAGEKLGWLK